MYNINYILLTNCKYCKQTKNKLDELNIMRIPSATNFITTYWDTEIKAKTITQKMLDRGIILRHLILILAK